MKLSVHQTSDGSVILSSDKGINFDLVFSFGAMSGDPSLDDQKQFAQSIVDIVNNQQKETE